MKCPNRAAERRPEVIAALRARGYGRTLDLTGAEAAEKKYFEGTGACRARRRRSRALAARRPRCVLRRPRRRPPPRFWCAALFFFWRPSPNAPKPLHPFPKALQPLLNLQNTPSLPSE
jgi:hypothetical protein